MKHTILGLGSPSDKALVHALLKDSHNEVSLVTNYEFWMPGTRTILADINSYEEVLRCINGSDIVYLCANSLHNSRDLKEMWLRILKSTINACRKTNSRLIYIDNSDVYGKESGILSEKTPCRPCSKNGKTLLDAALLIESEANNSSFNYIIARSSEIYGPSTNSNSFLNSNVISRLLKGESARWFINPYVNQSFTLLSDLVNGVILLSGDEKCYNQIWHLPTSPPLSGETFIHMVSNILNVDPVYSVISGEKIWFTGLFNKHIAIPIDLLYRYESGVYFDSSKFNDYFSYIPQPYYTGIQETIEYLKGS